MTTVRSELHHAGKCLFKMIIVAVFCVLSSKTKKYILFFLHEITFNVTVRDKRGLHRLSTDVAVNSHTHIYETDA